MVNKVDNKDRCYLTGCKYNTGVLLNKCIIKAVTKEGNCKKFNTILEKEGEHCEI